MKEEASEEFLSMFMRTGSCAILCEYCGRQHFSTNKRDWDFDEVELERYIEGEKKNPKKYVDWGYDAPSWIDMFGKQYVIDCCYKAEYYEPT